MGRPGASAGLQTRRPGWPKNAPWPGRISARRCVMGRLLLGVGRDKRARLSCLLHLGSAPPVRRAKAAEPRGAREADAVQVATQLRETRTHCCDYSEGRSRRNTVSASLRVQAERLRLRRATARQSGISQLKLSEKQAKAIFISNDASHCVSCRRQRFPTVRMVGEVGNGEFRAKIENLCPCASTVVWKRPEFIGDSRGVPVEIGCITAGKTVRMQQE
jgi:hypothetical protein